MKTNFDWMRERLLLGAGVFDWKVDLTGPSLLFQRKPQMERAGRTITVEELQRTEWNEEFVKRMHAGLVMGALRGYGRLRDPFRKRHDWAQLGIDLLKRYQETGNKQLLVDASNMGLLEFTDGRHPKAHLDAEDSSVGCYGTVR